MADRKGSRGGFMALRGAEARGEEFASAVQPGAECAGRASERMRGLVVAQFLEVAEHHSFAVDGRQREDGAAHARDLLAAQQVFTGVGGGDGPEVSSVRAGQLAFGVLSRFGEGGKAAFLFEGAQGVV